MAVARIVGAVGRCLITAGVLLLLFVAYQLYGTGLAEARAQDDLRDEFEASLAGSATASSPSTAPATTASTAAPTTTEPGTGEPAATTVAPTTTAPPAPRTPRGEAVAIIRIPAIGVDKAVVEGVGVGDLKKGPGHYPGTPLPGQPGNSAIAGHRTTYGAPFGDLGELEEGDEIRVTTRQGEFRYAVDRISVVSPDEVEVLRGSDEARLTLTTCHPKYSARQRLVVSGVLVDDPAPAPPVTEPADPAAGTEPEEPATAAPGSETDAPGVTAPAEPPADDPVLEAVALEEPALTGDPSARGPAAAWAAATALVALAAWLLGRRWHRWPAYLLALPLGTGTLFLCFEQVSRLLPPNI